MKCFIWNFLHSLKRKFEHFFLFTVFEVIRKNDWYIWIFHKVGGFHVSCSTVNWVAYVGQNIIFKGECNNKQEWFAVADRTLSKDCISSSTAGYVPRECSIHTWYAIQDGDNSKQLFIRKRPDLLPQWKVDS